MKTYIVIAFFLSAITTKVQAQVNRGKKILIVATNSDSLRDNPGQHGWGCFTPEICDFYGRLYQEGFRAVDFDIVSLKGGTIPLVLKPNYKEKYKIRKDEQALMNEKMKHSLTPSQINPNDYNVIYYAGGFSCQVDFPTSDSIAELATNIYENGGVVGAVCDGIAGLIPIKLSDQQFLISEKKLTANGWRNSDTDYICGLLIKRGAAIQSDDVVVDGRLVTAKGVKPVPVAEEILKILGIIKGP